MSGRLRNYFAVHNSTSAVSRKTEVTVKQVFDRKTFTGEVVVLDDVRYFECVFVSCTLRYSGGNWDIDDCQIANDCTWNFTDAAWNTMTLLKQFGMIRASTIFDSKNPPPQIH